MSHRPSQKRGFLVNLLCLENGVLIDGAIAILRRFALIELSPRNKASAIAAMEASDRSSKVLARSILQRRMY